MRRCSMRRWMLEAAPSADWMKLHWARSPPRAPGLAGPRPLGPRPHYRLLTTARWPPRSPEFVDASLRESFFHGVGCGRPPGHSRGSVLPQRVDHPVDVAPLRARLCMIAQGLRLQDTYVVEQVGGKHRLRNHVSRGQHLTPFDTHTRDHLDRCLTQ